MTETGKRYGTSLYDLAAEEGLTERILAELDVAVNAMQEPGYLRLLMTPSVPKKERCVLLDQAFAQAHPYLVNFLKILCESEPRRHGISAKSINFRDSSMYPIWTTITPATVK